jgi:hypothetical protein
MPRFGTKALFIGFAVAAVWLSTFSGYSAGQDVRRSILLLVLVSSGLVAVYSGGRRRAFWSTFFFVMLLCGGLSYDHLLYRYIPDFSWLELPPAADPNPPSVSPYVPVGVSAPAPATPPVMTAPPPDYVSFRPAGSTMQDAWIATIAAAWTIGLSLLAAFIAVYFCSQMTKSSNESD